MQAPDQERQQNLEKWYKDRLGTAKEAGIITGFFHNAVDEQAQRNSASEGAMFHAAGAQAASVSACHSGTTCPGARCPTRGTVQDVFERRNNLRITEAG